MKFPALLLSLFSASTVVDAGTLATGSGHPSAADTPAAAAAREEWNIGGVLFPHFHFQAVYGQTSFDEGEEFIAGHHDPFSDGWSVQGFELGLSGRFSEHVEGFATWHGYWASESPHTFDSEFEEYFLKLKNLPGGLELRGGQFLNRFGLHNSTHLHGWDWVDNYLVNGRFLGDDGLTTRGAEITWRVPVDWTSGLSLSWGDVRAESHGHHHEHGGHEEMESPYEAEGAAWADRLTTVLWTNQWNLNDFNQFRGGLSAAWGDNRWGRTTALYGAHVQYEWRQNGLESGGDYLRWRTEVLWRDAGARSGHLPGDEEVEEEGEMELAPVSGTIRDWGVYSSVVWGKALKRSLLETGLRYDYVSGTEDAALPSRYRISPGVSWFLDNRRSAWVRLHGNFDEIDGHGSEQSVWLGFGINYGGSEVR